MSVLSRLESLFEAVFEGSFRRLFSPRLQPIEIARALERAMFDAKVVGPSGVEVPSRYVARISPVDFERFAPASAAHERSLAAYVDRRADEEAFRPLSRIQVELRADPSVSRSFVRVDTQWEQPPSSDETPAVERTRRFERVREPRPTRVLLLETEDGEELAVRQHPIRIGRGADNDLVIRDIRVSRYHVSIEPAGEDWIVRDLQSTNGTYFDGDRVEELRVAGPMELSLGGYFVKVRPS